MLVERRSAQHARQQAVNQLKAAIVTLEPRLRSTARAAQARITCPQLRCCDPSSTRRYADWQRGSSSSRHELADVDRELQELTRTLCPRLLDQPGVGPVCAAQIIVSTANPNRIRSEPAFAALAGVSPIEASSGHNKRHRLNRSGDRQLNWALHMSALNRIRYHPETRAYYQRQLERGKTRREGIRIIKRALARRLYRTLTTADA